MIVNYRFEKNDKANDLKLSYKKLDNRNYLVTATAVDINNLRRLDYQGRVYFQCMSGKKTIKNQGTPNDSESIKMANGQASIEVIPDKNKMEVMVLNQNFKGTYMTIKKEGEN